MKYYFFSYVLDSEDQSVNGNGFIEIDHDKYFIVRSIETDLLNAHSHCIDVIITSYQRISKAEYLANQEQWVQAHNTTETLGGFF